MDEDNTIEYIKLITRPLSKDNLNVIYVPIGNMPKGKAEEYLGALNQKIKMNFPEYKCLLIPVTNQCKIIVNETEEKEEVKNG